MKIAMIGQKGIPAASGGVERHVEELSKRLVCKGYQVTVYCRPYYSDSRFGKYENITLRHLPTINTKHLDAITHTFISSLDSLFRDYDIVHYHALGPATLSFIPGLVGKKTIVTVHGLDWQREKWGPIAKICLKMGEKASVNFPDKTIVVSDVLKEYYKNRFKADVITIPNGVKIRPGVMPKLIKEFGLEENNYCLFLARLVPEKGCHHLLEAWPKVYTAKKLVIAGDASHSEDYVSSLYRMATDRVIFTGRVQGQLLQELFTNAYLYILPSEIEGLPISLLEAMSYGLPTLVSNIPENIEAIGECGFTFESANQESLAKELQFLLDNDNITQTKGSLAQKRVAMKYAWEKIVDQTEEVYRSVLP
jgi:glycosyltransferase involved in cell wall biosynthesis